MSEKADASLEDARSAEDASLQLAELRGQEAGAFRKLVERHQQIVMGLGQAMGLRGADLDDAAAEVFANVYRALPGFAGRSAVGTWVHQIACRTLRKYRVRSRKHQAGEQQVGELAEEIADTGQKSPLAESEAREQNERIWAKVAGLEPRQAMAIELCYRRGWPLEQIAAVMECPVGTVKTLLFRAREQLRRTLGEGYTSGGK